MVEMNEYPYGRVGHNAGEDCPCLPEVELLDVHDGECEHGARVLLHGNLEPE